MTHPSSQLNPTHIIIMEINITSLIKAFSFSHSIAEGGEGAGQRTWNAAKREGQERPLLSGDQLEAFREHVRGFGAWDQEEIAAWDETECNALFLQMVSGDIRECPARLDGVAFFKITGEGWHYEREQAPDLFFGPFESRSLAYCDACLAGREPRAESLEEIDWKEYAEQAEAGRIAGRLYSNDGGSYYYSLSE
jgi:hypothetical protein